MELEHESKEWLAKYEYSKKEINDISSKTKQLEKEKDHLQKKLSD